MSDWLKQIAQGAENTEKARVDKAKWISTLAGGLDKRERLREEFGGAPTREERRITDTSMADPVRTGPRIPAPEPPDILTEQFGKYRDELEGLEAEAFEDAQGFSSAMRALGQGYGDTMRGSEGYTGLQDFRDEMRGIYEAGGLTDVTKANLAASRRDADQWLRGQREASMQDLAERGMAGGGAELLAGIGARGAAADRMSARDLETNAFAQEQALQALQSARDASGDLYGYDKDIAETGLTYDTRGADEEYSVRKDYRDRTADTWQQLFDNTVERSGDAWQTAADQVPGAQHGAVNALTTPLPTGALDTSISGLENTGEALSGVAGKTPPTMPGPVPGVVGQANPGEAISGGTSVGAGGVEGGVAAYNAFNQPDPPAAQPADEDEDA